MRIELQRRFEQAGYKVSSVDWVILAILLDEEGLSQNEIAAKTIKDKTTIARQIDKLEERKLIQRVKESSDQRVSLVYLSDQGKELISNLIPIVQQVLRDCASGIAKEELEVTKQCLKTILSNLGQ
jgi:DNA-binding MarR family transcriptional regulator